MESACTCECDSRATISTHLHRQFPIPWDKSQQYDSQVVDALRTIFSLDRALRAKADLMKAPGNGGGSDGSAVAIGSDRHMCLINYHDGDPNNTKAEPYYGMGRTAISWHVDKGTEKGSSIMCYNHSMSRNGADAGSDASAEGWSIAMKVAWDVDTPAICTRLKDGETYYMLGRFNDTHAHAVIAGTCPRFSTTHRTIILRPCDVLSNVVASAQKAIETVREWKWSWRRLLSACGVVFHSTGTPSPESEFTYPATEDLTTVLATADHIEFEWIRPFWLHGAEYASARPDWTREMEMLEDVWFALEGHLVWVVEIAVGRSSTYSTNIIDRARVLLCVLQERQKRRNVWKARYDNIVAPATLGKDSDSVSKDSARACIQRPLSSERGGIGESVPEIREQSGQDCKGDARIDATKSVQFGSLGCVRVRRESRGDCVALQYDLGVTLSRVRAAIA